MSWWPFQPACPVDEDARLWIHQRLHWLADQFGMHTWTSAQAVEPTDQFFPDRFDRDQASVQRILERVCRFMHVDPARVELRLYSEDRNRLVGDTYIKGNEKGSAGTYRAAAKEIISVESSTLADPMAVVATVAHELAHARLLGERRLTGDEEDHEPLTDLATVFFGLGIFNANATFRYSQWTRGGWQGWSAKTQGYLDERMFAYALALWTLTRNDPRPTWMRHLRLNPRTYMKQSLRHLHKNPPPPLADAP